jgi:hypothetical protein
MSQLIADVALLADLGFRCDEAAYEMDATRSRINSKLSEIASKTALIGISIASPEFVGRLQNTIDFFDKSGTMILKRAALIDQAEQGNLTERLSWNNIDSNFAKTLGLPVELVSNALHDKFDMSTKIKAKNINEEGKVEIKIGKINEEYKPGFQTGQYPVFCSLEGQALAKKYDENKNASTKTRFKWLQTHEVDVSKMSGHKEHTFDDHLEHAGDQTTMANHNEFIPNHTSMSPSHNSSMGSMPNHSSTRNTHNSTIASIPGMMNHTSSSNTHDASMPSMQGMSPSMPDMPEMTPTTPMPDMPEMTPTTPMPDMPGMTTPSTPTPMPDMPGMTTPNSLPSMQNMPGMTPTTPMPDMPGMTPPSTPTPMPDMQSMPGMTNETNATTNMNHNDMTTAHNSSDTTTNMNHDMTSPTANPEANTNTSTMSHNNMGMGIENSSKTSNSTVNTMNHDMSAMNHDMTTMTKDSKDNSTDTLNLVIASSVSIATGLIIGSRYLNKKQFNRKKKQVFQEQKN